MVTLKNSGESFLVVSNLCFVYFVIRLIYLPFFEFMIMISEGEYSPVFYGTCKKGKLICKAYDWSCNRMENW